MSKIRNFHLRNLFFLLEIDKIGFWLNGLIITFFSTLVFGAEILFALTLQRFLVSVDLLQDLDNTRILGNIRNPIFEASILLIVLIFRLIFIGLNSTFNGYGYARFENKVRTRIAFSVFTSPTNEVSKISYLLNEISLGSSNFVSTIYLFLSRFSALVFLLSSLIFYSWFITLLIVLVCAVIYPLQKYFSLTIKEISSQILKLAEESSRTVLAGARNYVFLKVRKSDKSEFEKASSNFLKILNLRKRFYTFAAMRSSIPQILGVIFVVLIAAGPLSTKLDNRSEIVPFLYLLLRFFVSLGDILRAASHLRLDYPRVIELKNWLHANKIDINATNFRSQQITPIIPGFLINSVEYQTPGDSQNLVYKNLLIPPGLITHVKGKNGSGKSSLLMLIAGIVEPSTGEIICTSFDSEKLESQNKEIELFDCKNKINTAYVGTNPVLISGSIRDNIIYGINDALSDSEIEIAAKVFGLFDFSENEFSLNKTITEDGRGLSAGQIQKISWTRALLSKPNLLIADEATSNLDADSKERVFDWMVSLKGKVTTIIVDHNVEKLNWIDKEIDLDTKA